MTIHFVFYILLLIARFLNFQDPSGEYAVYCDNTRSFCQVENDALPDQPYVIRRYPIECVNGEWMQVNRSPFLSGREDVFDVGEWNYPAPVFGGCGDGVRWK